MQETWTAEELMKSFGVYTTISILDRLWLIKEHGHTLTEMVAKGFNLKPLKGRNFVDLLTGAKNAFEKDDFHKMGFTVENLVDMCATMDDLEELGYTRKEIQQYRIERLESELKEVLKNASGFEEIFDIQDRLTRKFSRFTAAL